MSNLQITATSRPGTPLHYGLEFLSIDDLAVIINSLYLCRDTSDDAVQLFTAIQQAFEGIHNEQQI